MREKKRDYKVSVIQRRKGISNDESTERGREEAS